MFITECTNSHCIYVLLTYWCLWLLQTMSGRLTRRLSDLIVDYAVPVPRSPVTDGRCFSSWLYMPHLPTVQFSLPVSFLFWMATKIFFFSVIVSSVVWPAHYQFCSFRPILYPHHNISFYCACCAGVTCPLARSASPGDTNLLEEPATPRHRLPPISPSALTVCIAWDSSQKLLKKLNFHRVGVKVLLQVESWVRSKKQVVVFNSHFSAWGEVSSVDQSWDKFCSSSSITEKSPGSQMDKALLGSDKQSKPCLMLVNWTGRPNTGRRSLIFRCSEIIGAMCSSKQESRQNVGHQQEQYREQNGVLRVVTPSSAACVVLVCTSQERHVEGAGAAQGSRGWDSCLTRRGKRGDVRGQTAECGQAHVCSPDSSFGWCWQV